MMYMQAGNWVFQKNGFADFMHFFQGHFLVSGIFNSDNGCTVYFIRTYLAQKNTMCANICFRGVLLNAFAYQ